jgi:hypothetical protein
MKIITIPAERTVSYETGNAFRELKEGKIVVTKDVETKTFFEFIETLIFNSEEFTKGGAKGAKRLRKLQNTLDKTDADGAEVLKLEDADYDAIVKTHKETMKWPPRALMVMLEFFEAFENPIEQTGPVPAAPATT